MPRIRRRFLVDPAEVGVYHRINRCVRRSFLCGKDPLSGKDYEHRRQWIQDRMQLLAGQFGVDILGYAVMSNHLHVVVRNRPDVVQNWLSPFELSEATADQPIPSARASNKGCLPMSFADYLNLLDWTGRQLRAEKRGAIPQDLAPILERLHISDEGWLTIMIGQFRRAAGRSRCSVNETNVPAV